MEYVDIIEGAIRELEEIYQYYPISTEDIINEAINKIQKEISEDDKLERCTKRLKKIENTKTY